MDVWQIILKNVALSTLHGWVGASLAVFMFFHPLKPWKIGRFRIWQGVIPAKQEQIAEAISEVVSSQLITPRALNEYLVQSRVLDCHVRTAWHSLLNDITSREYPSLESMLPAPAAGMKDDLKEFTKKVLAARAEKYLTEPEVAAWIETFLKRQLSSLWNKKLGEVLPEETADIYCRRLLGNISEYLEGPEFRKAFLALLNEQYQAICSQEAPLKDVLPGPVKEKISEWPARLVQVLPELLQRLQENEEILVKLTKIILDAMEQLKEKRLLARVSLDLYQLFNNYHKDVRSFVSKDMFPRLIGFLSSPEIQAWLESYIQEQTDRILEQPVGELARGLSPEQLSTAKEWLAASAVKWAAGDGVREWLREFLMGQYRALSGHSLAGLAVHYSGLKQEYLETHLIKHGSDLINQPSTLRFVRLSVRALVEEFARYPVGRLKDRFHRETLERIEETGAVLVTSYLQNQIPAFLGGLDIKGIARAKIEGYSPKQLVGMFRQVTMNSMQKIEIYGALIGAVMGVFFGLANLRGDAFWLISAALVLVIGLLRWGSLK